MSTDDTDNPIEILFLGTGTSTGLPLVPCLTLTQPYPHEFARHLPLLPDPDDPATATDRPVGAYDPDGVWPDNIPCACCRSAVSDDVPEGWKNRRGNTSVVVRKQRDGQWRNVVVDVGKTFKEQSQRFFPIWGVDRIDAVVLTHGHADAYFGLDDLREWCFRQGCVIPIYLTQETFEMVASSFPYLVDKTKASGGGDVPSLRFHIIANDEDFQVEDIRIKALAVEHGVYFHNDARTPLICLGFMFDESIIYMSDVSRIPESTWKRMLDRSRPTFTDNHNGTSNGHLTITNETGDPVEARARAEGRVVIPPTPQDTPRARSPVGGFSKLSITPSKPRNGSDSSTSSKRQSLDNNLPILIIDALWPIKRHSSHTNLPEALEIALRLNPSITYVVDLVHPITHYMLEELGRSVGKGGPEEWIAKEKAGAKLVHPDDAQARDLVRRWWSDEQVKGELGERLKRWTGRVEPGWDGLVVRVKDGVWEEVRGKRGSTKGWTR